MHNDAEFVPLKVNSIIAEAKAMKGLAGPFKVSELMQVALEHLARQPAKLAQNMKLQFARHFRQLRRARWIENNLELHGAKCSRVRSAVFSTHQSVRVAENASRCRRCLSILICSHSGGKARLSRFRVAQNEKSP